MSSQSSESEVSASDEHPGYRVEEADGSHAGWSKKQPNAEAMADECERLAPESGPHQVREVPPSESHEDGKGIHRVVYTAEGDS